MTQINQIQKKKSVMQTKKSDITEHLLKKPCHNDKITEIKSKLLRISGIATYIAVYNAALIAVKNKIPDVSNLVKKHRL